MKDGWDSNAAFRGGDEIDKLTVSVNAQGMIVMSDGAIKLTRHEAIRFADGILKLCAGPHDTPATEPDHLWNPDDGDIEWIELTLGRFCELRDLRGTSQIGRGRDEGITYRLADGRLLYESDGDRFVQSERQIGGL